MKVYAREIELGAIEGEGLGPLGLTQQTPAEALGSITDIVSSIIGIITIIAIIWFLLQLLIGGFHWISSAGDSKKLASARERISQAFIGLMVVMASWGLLAITGQLLGIENFLITNPGEVIESLQVGQ